MGSARVGGREKGSFLIMGTVSRVLKWMMLTTITQKNRWANDTDPRAKL